MALQLTPSEGQILLQVMHAVRGAAKLELMGGVDQKAPPDAKRAAYLAELVGLADKIISGAGDPSPQPGLITPGMG